MLGDPLRAALPPPYQPSCNTGATSTGGKCLTDASTAARAEDAVNVSSGADPNLLLGRAKGGPAVALLTGRPTAVGERYVF